MRKNRIKDAVLVILILCSVILAFNTWTDEKLWPDDYNFFSIMKQKLGFTDEYSSFGSLSRERLARPHRIVVNNSAKRSVYFDDASGFDNLVSEVRGIFDAVLSNERFEACSEVEWYTALKNKSIFVTYPVSYDMTVIADIFEMKEPKLDVGSMSEFVITYDNQPREYLTVLIRDDTNNLYTKCHVQYNVTKFQEILEHNATESVGMLPYSFELNFDKVGDATRQKALIGSEVLLAINPTTHKKLQRTNPIVHANNEYNSNVMENILKGFGYNPSSVRKYMDADDVVYVENYGTIRFSKSGLVEYKAIANDKGISLEVSNPDNLREVYTASLRFVSELWQGSMEDIQMNLRVSSDVVRMGQGSSFKITMNYFSDGCIIRDDVSIGVKNELMTTGVEMTVSSGRIVSYRQLFRIYTKTEEEIYNSSTIDAIDELFADERFSSTGTVMSISPAYAFDDSGECYITYVAKDDNGAEFLIEKPILSDDTEETASSQESGGDESSQIIQ